MNQNLENKKWFSIEKKKKNEKIYMCKSVCLALIGFNSLSIVIKYNLFNLKIAYKLSYNNLL